MYGGKVASDLQSNITIDKYGNISGTLNFIEGGLAPGVLDGDGYFLALHWTDPAQTVTSLKVGLVPSSTGMEPVEAIDDTDRNGVFKITNKSQRLKFVQSDAAGHKNIQIFTLDGLIFDEGTGA